MPPDYIENLIKHRIERSRETIREAEFALSNNMFNLAENRIYYAIFYIVQALALKDNFTTSKHSQLLGWFNKNFIKSKIFPVNIGKIYNSAYEKRQESDYEDYKIFEKEEVIQDIESAKTFIESVLCSFLHFFNP